MGGKVYCTPKTVGAKHVSLLMIGESYKNSPHTRAAFSLRVRAPTATVIPPPPHDHHRRHNHPTTHPHLHTHTMSTTEEAPAAVVAEDAAVAPAADADAAPAADAAGAGDAAADAAPAADADAGAATPTEPVRPKKVGRPSDEKKTAALEAINARKKEITTEQVGGGFRFLVGGG